MERILPRTSSARASHRSSFAFQPAVDLLEVLAPEARLLLEGLESAAKLLLRLPLGIQAFPDPALQDVALLDAEALRVR